MLFLPSGRTTDLSKSNSASAWITMDWRTDDGAGLAAAAGADGAAGAAGEPGARGGGGQRAPWAGRHSGSIWPLLTMHAPDESFTAWPEESCTFGPASAKAVPAANASAPSVSGPRIEIFMFGTPKRMR